MGMELLRSVSWFVNCLLIGCVLLAKTFLVPLSSHVVLIEAGYANEFVH